ncbi:ABC transporter ATP-binding protein [Actinomycetaceae bacterium TAE3-ERU4]|nr:ABC transporter ATP-binding protein [Actinomycetaceae bacterium TAE3-ERU4]
MKNYTNHPRLQAENITLAYGERVISQSLKVDIPKGKITVIVGPNACGKSTLLKSLSRLLKPHAGSVLLEGKDIHSLPTKTVARKLGFLPQSPVTPRGITVRELVARGRYPHQTFLQQWSQADEKAVEIALKQTAITNLQDRYVDELSGGQRQRAWIALTLAQDTPLLLLDEPTTYLDIVHQVEVLNLCTRINREAGRTVVIVLHDLNQAARYADHVIMMREGQIKREGKPAEIFTVAAIKEVFGLDVIIADDPISHTPMIIPTLTQGEKI